MMLHYQEPSATVYCGHALDLKELPAESVDMCITSPPYWGLRTYKTEPQIWDSKDGCGHEWVTEEFTQHSEQKPVADMKLDRQFCLKCNAWRGELGLEPTIELYISHLIQIFNEVKRVLKKTGTCWVNIDDSYNANYRGSAIRNEWHKQKRSIAEVEFMGKPAPDRCGIPAKSLCLIPQRFAIAMVEQGWILRNDICWNKPNPMPESVKDRFTGSWEHLYFFVKSKKYWFEQQFEAYQPSSLPRMEYPRYALGSKGDTKEYAVVTTNYNLNELGRNKRDVWEITTQGYPEAHFATFPEKLCETPILAGCPKDGVVLDPFCGSGTTLAVAKRLNRKGIGVDINPDYCKLAVKRIQKIPIPMELI